MKRVAAVVLACQMSLAAAADQTLGRLFFTPEQRAQLDSARRNRAQRPVIEAAADEAPPAARVTYSGMVKRSDGRSTIWINNRPVHERAPGEAGAPRARVDEEGAASITLPQQQRSIRLKVGQTAELASGHVAESYARRPAPAAVEPPPAPAAEPLLRLRRRHDFERDLPPASDAAP